jgi:Dolichyl-phosphate-mannose-protein mannosyltransferase
MRVVKDLPSRTEPSQKGMLCPRFQTRGWFVFLMLLGISGYLYLNLFLLPNVPILLSGDQVFFWMNGQRMLHGERPYLDFFQFTPPGADVFYFALFKVLGPRIWPLNFVVLVLGVALCWLCFVIANQIMERRLALLSALLFLTLIYTRLPNATHHYFSVLAVMGATAVLMREASLRRLAIAGALLGVASFFTQTHGLAALLAFTLLLCWEQYSTDDFWEKFWRKERILLLGFILVLLILSAPFIASVGLKQIWYCQVTYVRKVMVHAPETHLLGMPEYSNWRGLPLLFVMGEYSRHVFVYGMLPTIYLLVLMRCRTKLSLTTFGSRKVALLGLVGSFLLGELIFSLNWLRLYAVSMPGIVLFIWVVSTTTRFRRYGLISLWALVVLLGLSQPWFAQHREYLTVELPAGSSAIEPSEFEKLSWGMAHTRPGEFLFQANWPGMYIPLGVRNPVFLDTASTMLNPPWVERAVQQLEAKQVRYIIWAERLDYPVDPHRPRTANIVPLRTYLHTHYRLARLFQDGDEVWERK